MEHEDTKPQRDNDASRIEKNNKKIMRFSVNLLISIV